MEKRLSDFRRRYSTATAAPPAAPSCCQHAPIFPRIIRKRKAIYFGHIFAYRIFECYLLKKLFSHPLLPMYVHICLYDPVAFGYPSSFLFAISAQITKVSLRTTIHARNDTGQVAYDLLRRI